MSRIHALSVLAAAAAAMSMSTFAVSPGYPMAHDGPLLASPASFPSRQRSRSTRSKNERNRKKMAQASKRANRKK